MLRYFYGRGCYELAGRETQRPRDPGTWEQRLTIGIRELLAWNKKGSATWGGRPVMCADPKNFFEHCCCVLAGAVS